MEIDTLLLAIVQREDADVATSALNQSGFSVTRISSIGGFLETGNVTLVVGLGSADVERAIAVLSKECQQRTVFVNAAAHVGATHTATFFAPIEAEVGGAVLFTFPVERYIRLRTDYKITDAHPDAKEVNTMQLIMAIVPEEISSQLTSGLTDLGYRATVISTTGGFRRRGNATLLMGIESERVDSVVEKIHEICNATKVTDSCATIFVLGVTRYERVQKIAVLHQ